MTQPGGAATHYGVLYQALGTIDAAFTISSRGDAEDPETITLTVEPRGGGGDTIVGSARRTVMQFKARSDDTRTWSLNEIIDDALPDLYRAVRAEPDSSSEYLLITEGREGGIERARAFFRGLSRDVIPDDPPSTLDDVAPHRYFPSGAPISDRKFFDDVTRRVCSTPADRASSLDEHRRVWSLLSRFDIRQEKIDDLAERVEQRLLGYVDAPEDVPGKARELYGILLQLAAKGQQTFTLPMLLRRADLPRTSLADLPSTRIVAAERLVTVLKHLGHDASTTVRRTSAVTEGDAIFCLAGGSGSGKSTLAAQIASDWVANEVVVFVSTRAGIDDALQLAADEVWKRVLFHGRVTDWESLIHQSRTIGLADRGRWLTVCLDITAGVGEVRQLLRLEWSKWNVRLLFTADEAAGKMVRNEPDLASQCAVQILGDLSISETYELLKKRGRSTARIPDYVASLLCRPILADVYCRVTRGEDWEPSNEYALFDAFWRDVVDGRDGTRHAQDVGILLRLGETLLEGEAPYPWPQDVLHHMSVSDEAQQRLTQHGWLRELESYDVEFAHERFANWAVARAMHERTARGRWAATDLSLRLAEIFHDERTPGKLYLGHVPMDVVWLLASHYAPTEFVVATIRSLDGSRSLYEELLPTMGPAIVPALHQLIREEGLGWYGRQPISACILEIASRDVIPEAVVVALLEDDIEEIHDTGLAVARMQPQPRLIDRLWRLQRNASGAPEKDTQSHWRSERAMRALMTAVRDNPDWIRTATRTAESAEELRTLAWLVSMLGDERGAALWRELKPVFLKRFGSEGARGGLQCIDRYNDVDEVDRLAGWVATGDNFVPAEALAALAAIDAHRALAIVEGDPLDRVEMLASFWLPPLLLHDTARTHAAVVKRFEESAFSSASLRWNFRGEDQIHAPMIAAVIKRLTGLLAEHLGAPKSARPPVEVKHLLELLGAVNSLDGLRALRGEAQSTLASLLVEFTDRYAPYHSNTLDGYLARRIQQVLLRIGGEPLSDYVVMQLNSPDDRRRPDIRSAVMSPSPKTLQLLIGLAEKPPANDREQIRSMEALHAIAALGEREAVVRLLERHAHLEITAELHKLLEGCQPLGDEHLSRLLSSDASEVVQRIRRLNLLSLSARSDVAERLIQEITEEANDDVKTSAFYAIGRLASSSTSIDAVLKIGFAREPEEVADLLCAIGTDEALDVLETYLEACDGDQISDALAATTAWLVTTKHRHALAVIVWQYLQSPDRHFRMSTTLLYDAAGYSAAPAVLDFLHKEAFGAGTDDRIEVVLGLSHHRPEAAFDAASSALASSEASRGGYADVLVELDAARAVDVLCQRLTRERVPLVRAYICRALRRMQNEERAQQRVRAMIASPDPYERAAGCQTAGWFDEFEDSTLRVLALREPDPMVRAFALGAVRMHQLNKRVAALLVEFASASGSYAWALLQAVLDSASPLLVAYRDDPLWLDHVLIGKPRALQLYAQRRVDEQLKDASGKKDDAFERYYR